MDRQKISVSGNRCNFFVNDIASLKNIIVPLFNENKLKSSKFSQFIIFEKAVRLFENKDHLLLSNKANVIFLHDQIKLKKELPLTIEINDSWLLGFIEGDASFSTSKYRPRLKFENHFKETKLLTMIKLYLNGGSLIIKTRTRPEFLNENPVVVLDIGNINILYNNVLSKYDPKHFLTKKKLDFFDWSLIVYLNYFGYHFLNEGILFIAKLKTQMNNFRLSTSKNKDLINLYSVKSKKAEFQKILKLEPRYRIENGIRINTITGKPVSEKTFF